MVMDLHERASIAHTIDMADTLFRLNKRAEEPIRRFQGSRACMLFECLDYLVHAPPQGFCRRYFNLRLHTPIPFFETLRQEPSFWVNLDGWSKMGWKIWWTALALQSPSSRSPQGVLHQSSARPVSSAQSRDSTELDSCRPRVRFSFVRPQPLPRQHLDLAVDSGDHLEFALVGAPFVACDGPVIALG
jgi:hypothetical protein